MLNSLRSLQKAGTVPWLLSPKLNRNVNIIGVMLIASAPFWLHELFLLYEETVSISLFAAVCTVGVVFLADLVLVAHCSRQHPALRRLMVIGLLAKIAAAGLYLSMVVRLYSYVADMSHYFWAAQEYAITYQQTGTLTFPTPLFGTNFPPFLGQCIFAVTGISLPVAMVVFASMSFWGAYFIYRAFSLSFPGSTRSDLLAALVFLFPSCIFWTANIGKDAVVMLGSGVATCGFAKIHHRAGIQGYLLLVAGLAVVMTVRPHMAGILAIAYICAYLFGTSRTGLTGLAIKAVGIPALLALTGFFVAQGAAYADMQDVTQSKSTVVNVAKNNAAAGGSTYGSSLGVRLALAPFLLIRPFPFEVRNFQAAFASLEGLCLLVMFWRRRRVLSRSLRRIRSNPFAMFLALYTVEFTIIFGSAITNFGLLNRQRVMLIPFTVMLFLGDSRLEHQVPGALVRVLRRRRPGAFAGVRSPATVD